MQVKLKNRKVLIIIPAYNEEGNISRVIEEIQTLDYPLEIIVIDDGSSDRTKKEANDKGVNVISLPFNLGIGGAVQTGFQYAARNDFDIAVQVDGDGQHDVKFLERLLFPIINDEVDMVIGSRFIPPYIGYKSSFVRRLGINFFANLISFLTKYKISDPTSGFRSFNKKLINIFSKYYPYDFPEPETIVIAGRFKLRIMEVPVQMRKREKGNSSIRYLNTLYYMIKVTFAIIMDKLKKKGNI